VAAQPNDDISIEPENGKQLLSESRRKEVFLALVNAQDQKIAVAQSGQLIMERFGITDSDVRQIEREGMENEWPPLE